MASNRSKSSPKPQTRPALTFEMAVQLCPHQGVAESVATAFGLIVPEYEEIRAEHAAALKQMAATFEGSLNDKATEMHFQRIVGALVSSAVGAGGSTPRRSARPATPPPGPRTAATTNTAPRSASKARRSAPANSPPTWPMQAYALLAAAHGAIDAYKDLTGDDWKAYEAQARRPGREEGRRLPDGSLRGLTPQSGDRKVPAALLPSPGAFR